MMIDHNDNKVMNRLCVNWSKSDDFIDRIKWCWMCGKWRCPDMLKRRETEAGERVLKNFNVSASYNAISSSK